MLSSSTTRAVFDPVHAHGAWVFLFASAGAGALASAHRGVEPGLLAATAFVGCFLVASGLLIRTRQRVRRVVGGTAVATLATVGALSLGAEPRFLFVGVLAVGACAATMVLARRFGLLSFPSILAGLGAIALAGPAAAVAGGASPTRAALLMLLTWPFFIFRTLAVLAVLAPLKPGAWDRVALRARGLREAALVAIWVLAVTVSMRVLG